MPMNATFNVLLVEYFPECAEQTTFLYQRKVIEEYLPEYFQKISINIV